MWSTYRETEAAGDFASPSLCSALVPQDSCEQKGEQISLNDSWTKKANNLYSVGIVDVVRMNRLRVRQNQFRSGVRKPFPVWRRRPRGGWAVPVSEVLKTGSASVSKECFRSGWSCLQAAKWPRWPLRVICIFFFLLFYKWSPQVRIKQFSVPSGIWGLPMSSGFLQGSSWLLGTSCEWGEDSGSSRNKVGKMAGISRKEMQYFSREWKRQKRRCHRMKKRGKKKKN